MELNEIKIKYQVNEDGSIDINWSIHPDMKIKDLLFIFISGSIDINWSIHPDMKIKDLLFIFNGSKDAFTQAAANKAKKEGIPTKKISSWLKDKSIKDLS